MPNSKYSKIIEWIFFKHYNEGDKIVSFRREEIIEASNELGLEVPKNLGDVLYSFRFRRQLPDAIREKSTKGQDWIIRLDGSGEYKFELSSMAQIEPNPNLVKTKILDSTPGIIENYSLTDEQALLAKIRYNRLIDIFTGITCYSLQNHLRTAVTGMGQVEIDEIYVGLDKGGVQYVLPVQAKGGSDKLGIVQIEQDLAVCEEKFPNLIPRSIAAQFMDDDIIALFEFIERDNAISILDEKHYKLVEIKDLSTEELVSYRSNK